MVNIKQETPGGELPIPQRLTALIERGLWPRTEMDERKQLLKSLVPKERIQMFAPEEEKIYLLRPPFRSVKQLITGGEGKFWATFAAPEAISPELSVVIGDFVLGSDSPILLDYSQDRVNPTVIRLKWRKSVDLPNVWVRCADSFDDFVNLLGLDRDYQVSEISPT